VVETALQSDSDDSLNKSLVTHALVSKSWSWTSVNVAADVDSVVADSLANSATPLRSLIVIPKRVRVLQSKCEVAHAKIITSSPYKRKLENAAEEKQKKANAKRKRSEKAEKNG